MKKKWLIGGVALLLVAGSGGAWFAGWLGPGNGTAVAKAGDKAAPALEFTSAEVVTPTRARMPSVVEFSGPLVAPQTAIVRTRAAGTLLGLDVAEGSRVKAGQPLGRIDLAELASRVAERRANLESARALLNQAERTLASNESLAAQHFISPIALDSSRAAVDTARAGLDAAKAALDTARLSLRDGSLLAPIAGIVAKLDVVQGETLAVDQALLTIVDLSRLELAGLVGTHEVSRLAPGMPVQVQVEGMAAPVAGRIARIAPATEPGTRSIGVTIALANPDERLRAGQYAVARATLADDTERLTLPVAAVTSAGGEDHVWVIAAGALARRSVTVGRRDDLAGRVEVLSGLAPDSKVLAVHFDNLREGAKASIVSRRAAAVASAAASLPVALK